jgi:HEAT repeat protein
MRWCFFVCFVLVMSGCAKSEAPAPAESLDSLTAKLKSPSARTRRLAAEAIGNFKGDALPALEPLTKALNDADDGVRAKVATA